MNAGSDPSTPSLPEALLKRLDTPGPRYTSYPTADRFVETFCADDYRRALAQRRDATDGGAPLSLYVHIPFCESVCYYCACNKVVTRHHERAGEYLGALRTEIELHVQALGRRQRVSQLHLGGGTPTFLSNDEVSALMAALREAFDFDAGAECSIEVDPRTVDAARLGHLAALGFNRLSLGVQDFDPGVQQAVHRVQPHAQVSALITAARSIGFESLNVDLIYGLPRQTTASFERTVAQVAALRPDRIALYAYAHLPARFKPQRRIDGALLPSAGQRVRMLGGAIQGFRAQGYSHIGMDHFALPADSLAVAKREGRLQRNFQGYSTQPDCDLIGLGVSAIGRIGASQAQNDKGLPGYLQAMRERRFATRRGWSASADDRLRRDVIMALMCQGRVDFDAIERAHRVDTKSYFRVEREQLRALVGDGLLTMAPTSVALTPLGWYAVRAVAMVFDCPLQSDPRRERFSRVL